VLNIFLSTFFTTQLLAQLTEINESPCIEEMAVLEIYSTEDGKVKFNADDFKSYEHASLLVFQPDNSIKDYDTYNCNSEITFSKDPSVWTIAIDEWDGGNLTKKISTCQKYYFKIMAICNEDTIFSNCVSYTVLNKSCSKLSTNKTLDPNDFAIYPQPTSEFIYVHNFTNQSIKNISLSNLTGQKLYFLEYDGISNNFEIQLPELKPGIYILQIKVQNQSAYVKKINIIK